MATSLRLFPEMDGEVSHQFFMPLNYNQHIYECTFHKTTASHQILKMKVMLIEQIRKTVWMCNVHVQANNHHPHHLVN